MLSRHAAALADTLLQDLMTGRQNPLDLIRIALVEQDDRVQVAVASVEDVANPQIVLLADGLDSAEHVRQFRPRHDAVLRAVTRSEPADGPECLLARFP